MNDIMFNILKTSLYVSIPIIAIVLLKNKILNKYTYKVNYIICSLIIIRMLFISNIEVYLPFDIPTNSSENILRNIKNISYESQNSIDYTKLIFIIWLTGCIYSILTNIYKQILFYRKINNISYTVKEESTLEVLEIIKQELNIKQNIKLLKVDGISSPAVIKIFKNEIVISNKEYSENQLKWIFRHELVHLKRKDNLLKLLFMIGYSIHWFNPLIKTFKIHFEELCELSCDEKVIDKLELKDRKDYALLLVNTLRYKNALKTTMMHSQFNTNQTHLVKRRVENMLNLKKCKDGKFIVVALCSIATFSVISFNLVNNQNQVYANQTPKKEESTYKKPTTDEELKENLKDVNYDEVAEEMDFYQDRKFEELTQEEIDYALEFLYTGKCKTVNIGYDSSTSINVESLNKALGK